MISSANSRNKHGHSINTGKNTLKRGRKSNDVHFELNNMFCLLHNDDQNLTTKRPTSTIPNIPRKFQLIAEIHLPMQLILYEITDRFYLLPRII